MSFFKLHKPPIDPYRKTYTREANVSDPRSGGLRFFSRLYEFHGAEWHSALWLVLFNVTMVNPYTHSIIKGVLQNRGLHIKVEYLQLYVITLLLKVLKVIVSCQVTTVSVAKILLLFNFHSVCDIDLFDCYQPYVPFLIHPCAICSITQMAHQVVIPPMVPQVCKPCVDV